MIGYPHFPSNIDRILGPKNKRIGVWERKTESEIEIAKKQIKKSAYSLVMPFGLQIIAFVASIFTMRQMRQSQLLYCILFSIAIFIVTFLAQIFKGRSFASNTSIQICNKCFKEDRLGFKKCYCGGEFEPQEFFSFIEKTNNKSPKLTPTRTDFTSKGSSGAA